MIVCYQDRRVGQAQRSPTKSRGKPRWDSPTRPTLLVLALLAIAIPPATAQEKFDPAARAKVVAPLIDEQTVAVLHVDLARMPVDALFAKALEILPELEPGLAEPRREISRSLKELEPVAGKEFYIVLSLADVGLSAPTVPLITMPLKPDADEKAIAKVFEYPNVAKKRVGNFLVIAAPETMKRLEGLKPQPRPELTAAFEAAGDTGAQVLLFVPAYARRAIEELMPELPKEIGGGPSTILTRGIRWIALGGDIAPQLSGRLVIQSQDAQAAEALRNKWVEGFKLAGQYKEVRHFVPQFDKLAALLTPKLAGDHVTITLDAAAVDTVLHALMKPLAAAEDASRREQSTRNLQQIGNAMHSYHDAHKCFPPAYTVDKQGKPLLSWRVLILPYLDNSALYNEFHLNEAWDSPHNRKLAETIIPVYTSPLSRLRNSKTNYLLPIGPGTVFGGKQPPKLSDIKDGTENTIFVVEVDDQHAVIWSKPDDLPYDPKEPLRGFRGMKDGFAALYCDCHVQFIPVTVDPKSLRAFFSAAAGDSPDW